MRIVSAAGTANGTIQWTGSELQVRIGGVWKRSAMYDEWDALYEFTTFTFTNCGKTGMDGPTLTECRASYSPSWTDSTSYFNVTGSYNGIQQWTVPQTAVAIYVSRLPRTADEHVVHARCAVCVVRIRR